MSLSSNSGRASPFRRPESPSSQSPATTIRATTPTAFTSNRPLTPSKLANSSTPSGEATFTPRSTREMQASPTKRGNSFTSMAALSSASSSGGSTSEERPREIDTASTPTATATAPSARDVPSPKSTFSRQTPTPSPQKFQPTSMDALSRLPPAQVREMRESFQILDQDSDGFVCREDAVEMLKSLGLDSSPASIAPYFPASLPHPLPMPVYLSQLSSLLAPLSPPSELLAALSAFDDDDSGQIDVNELVEAVADSRPDDGGRSLSRREIESVIEGFVGRRAFGGFSTSISKSKGEVFRYREWVAGLGAAGGSQTKAAAAS